MACPRITKGGTGGGNHHARNLTPSHLNATCWERGLHRLRGLRGNISDRDPTPWPRAMSGSNLRALSSYLPSSTGGGTREGAR